MIKAICSSGSGMNRVTLQSSGCKLAFPMARDTNSRVFKGISEVDYVDSAVLETDRANSYSRVFDSAPKFENSIQLYDFIRRVGRTYSKNSMMMFSSNAFYSLSGPFIGRELRYLRIPFIDVTPDRFTVEYGWCRIRKKGIEVRATNLVRGTDALVILYSLIVGEKNATFKDPVLVD